MQGTESPLQSSYMFDPAFTSPDPTPISNLQRQCPPQLSTSSATLRVSTTPIKKGTSIFIFIVKPYICIMYGFSLSLYMCTNTYTCVYCILSVYNVRGHCGYSQLLIVLTIR